MRRRARRIPVVLTLALAVVLGSARSARTQEAPPEDLVEAIAALEAELARLKAQVPASERLAELERRIDLLAAEIEKTRTGGAAEGAAGMGVKGLAPAASKVYGISRGVSVGGYGEALYENVAAEREDGAPSARDDQFDYLRQILYVGYKFSDSVLFNSEIEFEHGSTGKGGEVSVEFAYLEFQLHKSLALRAGMLLVPMGFVNELHEPPIFHGARRPDVESAVIPSTWRENGAGVYGEAGPFEWRAYVVAGLSSAGFTAAGIRGGRQSGARSRAEDLALTGRLDYTGVPGLLLGGSFFAGDSGQGATQQGRVIGGRVGLVDVHAQYERRGLQLRALVARGTLGDVALINAQNGLTGSESVGEAFSGWYVQAAYDLMTWAPRGTWSIAPFARYERLDTQQGVPQGFAESAATERRLWTLGVGVKPLANVVIKADYQWASNRAKSGIDQLNLAVGFLF